MLNWKYSLFVGILVVLSFEQVRSAFPCPNPEDIQPCTCTEISPFKFDFDCYDIEYEWELRAIFNQSFIIKTFRQFAMHYTRRSGNYSDYDDILKDDTFGESAFEKVDFSYTGLYDISTNAFIKSAQTLQEMQVTGGNLTHFPFESLSNHSVLVKLDLSRNNFSYIPAFESQSLIELDFSWNPITNVDTTLLESLSNLENLDFRGCEKITEIPNLKSDSLKSVKLGYASITNVASNAFQDVPNIEEIDLNGGDITEIESGSFSNLNSLKSVDLSGNKLTSIPKGIIEGTVNDFSLSYNSITELTQEVWEPLFKNVGRLSFAGNPLKCLCDIAWLVRNQDYMRKVAKYTRCADGTPIVDLNPAYYEYYC